MSSTRSVDGPEERDSTWTNETLPLSLRRELLERELKKLGFHKAGEGGSARAGGSSSSQQPQGGSSRPQAEGDARDHSE